MFFTGDELVMPGEPLPPGAHLQLQPLHAERPAADASAARSRDYGIVPDRSRRRARCCARAAAGNDLIVTSGGVSVGEEDHVKPAVEAEGRLSMWKIAIKPGRPLAFGEVDAGGGRKAHFIGLPGNPVSSFVTFLIFVRPFILRCQGVARVEPLAYPLRADFDWAKPDARREFLRVKLNAAGGLDLFANQSSAVLTSTVWADGLVDNPAEAGDPARRHGAIPAFFGAVPVNVRDSLLCQAARGDGHRARRCSICRRRRRRDEPARAPARARRRLAAALAPGKAVRVAVNQDMARDDTPVKAGDEVAFFPPVTGG